MRQSPEGAQDARGGGASLASVVLRKREGDAPAAQATDAKVSPPTEKKPAPTPLADAMRQAPAASSPAARTQRHAAETIVEDYGAKRQLNLPATLVVYHERAGHVAEQYRRIRDALMADNPKREPQMLVVTSSVGGEGKTTTVLNLGLSLVEIHANRVLLIDGCLSADERHPSLSALLKMTGERGLAEMLTSPPEEVQSWVRATPWHHLYVLPSGAKTVEAAAVELLKSAALRTCLRRLRANFDWILIDSPAAMTLPDAGLLGGVSDGMLVTVAMHHTPREKAQTTVRRLRSMNLPVKSCILTRA